MPWTEETEQILTDMWLWGHSSNNISAVLSNVTRNAVMGKVNRLKLMGLQGAWLRTEQSPTGIKKSEITQMVATLIGEPYQQKKDDHFILAVMIMMMIAGRNIPFIADHLRAKEERVVGVIKILADKKIWQTGDPPPFHWWDKASGDMSLLLDSMVASGSLAFYERSGDRHYSAADKANLPSFGAKHF